MKINASETIKNIKGTPFTTSEKEDLTLGMVIAEALATDQTGGKMKVTVLAQRFFQGGEQEVDKADLQLIKKSLESCKSYTTNLITGQALLLLEDVKED